MRTRVRAPRCMRAGMRSHTRVHARVRGGSHTGSCARIGLHTHAHVCVHTWTWAAVGCTHVCTHAGVHRDACAHAVMEQRGCTRVCAHPRMRVQRDLCHDKTARPGLCARGGVQGSVQGQAHGRAPGTHVHLGWERVAHMCARTWGRAGMGLCTRGCFARGGVCTRACVRMGCARVCTRLRGSGRAWGCVCKLACASLCARVYTHACKDAGAGLGAWARGCERVWV